MTQTAGQKLRSDLERTLAYAVNQHGPLEFDEVELQAIEKAVLFADRAQELRQVFADELVGERNPSALTKLSAESRHLDRAAMELARGVAAS